MQNFWINIQQFFIKTLERKAILLRSFMSRCLWKPFLLLPQNEGAFCTRGVLFPNGICRRGKVTVSRNNTGQNEAPLDLHSVRNVGVMAHIDAGKTTTTERFLYYSGIIKTPGEVHHGDTVTDFLPQERERGITIQSAVVSFPWKKHTINLIDTPGHVDFTFEVQRSLRVVDAAIAILDASAGVEAQTLTVWRQATDYSLPRIIYLNKMDKSLASVDLCLDSISSKLKCVPLLLQLPSFDKQNMMSDGEKGSRLCGVVELVEMRRLLFDKDTKGAKIIAVDAKDDKSIQRKHNELVEQLADLDGLLADKIIESESVESITSNEIHAAIRRVTNANLAVPVLLGSSYKNVGVQPLLDSIIRYFPEPCEGVVGDAVVKAYGSDPCLFAFKTMHDPQLGPLTFLRVFSGSFQCGHKIYNVSRLKHEKVSKVYLPLADELMEANEASAGQVVIVSGLKETVTGDTLTSSHSVSTSVGKKLQKKSGKEEDAVLSRVIVPEPVFFCSIEPYSLSHSKSLELALECLQREDPSLHVHVDPDTNQTILSGMGELHLDIIHARLKTEFKVEADLGKIQVAYKETIINPVSKRTTFERRLADQKHNVYIELELTPVPKGSSKLQLYHGRDKDKGENLGLVTDKQLKHIQNGIDSAMRFGPKLSFPMSDIEVTLHWFETTKWTSETIIEAAAASCFRECVQASHIYLLEPVVSLEVIVDERFQHDVLEDLHRRRFTLQEVNHKHGNKLMTGSAPLSELMGYSTILRTLSSGLGTFSIHFSHYQVVNNPSQELKIVTSVRGF